MDADKNQKRYKAVGCGRSRVERMFFYIFERSEREGAKMRRRKERRRSQVGVIRGCGRTKADSDEVQP